MTRYHPMTCGMIPAVLLAVLAVPLEGAAGAGAPKSAAKSDVYRVPYQLTETQHILVRIKVGDKGPFHFIIDTGAPALFVGTEAAKKMGVKPNKNGWATFKHFEIEGGAMLDQVEGRVEDPFQLIGMNKMNLPGVRLDGVIGYTILAQYRITFDFTKPHLLWTKLDWEPPPPVGLADMGGKAPPELAAMGGLVQMAAALIGRRPDPLIIPRGFIGVELEDSDGITVRKVLPSSPAADAGLREGDKLVRFAGKEVANISELQKRAGRSPAGKTLEVEIARGGNPMTIAIKPAKGL